MAVPALPVTLPVIVDPVIAIVGVLLPDIATPFIELGVIAPRMNVSAGIVVGFVTVAETPLALTTEMLDTLPAPVPDTG